MRILQVIDSLGRGGAETLVVNIVKSLPQFEHFIISLSNVNEFKEEFKGHNNIKLFFLGSRSVKALPINIIKLRRAIHTIRPDIIHSHLYWSNVIARLSSPKHIRFFFTNHSLQGQSLFKKKWLIVIEKLTYKKRHTLISVSKTVEEDYNKIIGIKGSHHILLNMADDTFFKGPKKYDPYKKLCFINVGRLHYQKNQSFLLRSFQHLSHNITLDVFGKGPLKTELEALQRQLRLKNVHLKGTSQNLSSILFTYDALIMSSRYEGFSIVVLEAMASGLPVFLPDSPVFREMGGDAAVYIDLQDEYSLKHKIEEMDNLVLTDLSLKSFERAIEVGKKEDYLKKLLNIYGITCGRFV
ncbi:MAG: glycosyltransferase [Ginsengibacter sp.]